MLNKIARWVDDLGRGKALVIAALLAVFFAVGDWRTGADVTFTLLYTLPVALAAWSAGRWALGIVAFEATASVLTSLPGVLPKLVWNHVGELGLLVLIERMVEALHTYVSKERTARENAVDQLRHAERLNTLGKLAAGVAHEIGTPLSVLLGHAQRLAREQGSSERVVRSATVIEAQVRTITRIVRSLLDFGRRQTGPRTLEDLAALARTTVTLLEPMAKQRGLRLQLVADGRVLATIHGGEIQQVLTNLIVNAIQATDAGQVVVRVEDAGSEVRVVVEDTGSGIAPDHIVQVFDPFFTTKDVGEGTGLGLSVSYGIVHDHGGGIAVASEVGRGTRFCVTLPKSPQSSASAPD